MITSGTILISNDAERPECFHLDDDDSSSGWTPLKRHLSFSDLDRELASKGWTFFYFANSITATAFGLDRAKLVHSALARLIANVNVRKCNCLEIDTVTKHSFLGMPCVNISAHPRHIQKGMVFSGQ